MYITSLHLQRWSESDDQCKPIWQQEHKMIHNSAASLNIMCIISAGAQSTSNLPIYASRSAFALPN